MEKEYFEYLKQVWSESLNAAGTANKELAMRFFDKAASPYHFWKESLLLADGQPVSKGLLSEKQRNTINGFLKEHPDVVCELKGKKVEELSKAEAYTLISDWIKRFKKKQ